MRLYLAIQRTSQGNSSFDGGPLNIVSSLMIRGKPSGSKHFLAVSVCIGLIHFINWYFSDGCQREEVPQDGAIVFATSGVEGRMRKKLDATVVYTNNTYERSKCSSCGHQPMLRMPCEWPVNVVRGILVDDRRSHSLITGLRSSAEAVKRCKPSLGFHAKSATA